MKVAVAELSGIALDYATAKAQGYFDTAGQKPDYWASPAGAEHFRQMHAADGHGVHWTHASTDWNEAGPIMERNGIEPKKGNPLYFPQGNENGDHYEPLWIAGQMHGPTALIAGLRCYVASKLGEEVDVPDALILAATQAAPGIPFTRPKP